MLYQGATKVENPSKIKDYSGSKPTIFDFFKTGANRRFWQNFIVCFGTVIYDFGNAVLGIIIIDKRYVIDKIRISIYNTVDQILCGILFYDTLAMQ